LQELEEILGKYAARPTDAANAPETAGTSK
jgi:hypothetical protein